MTKRIAISAAAAFIFLAAGGSSAQSQAALTAVESKAHGKYLADGQGRALYLLEADAKGNDRWGEWYLVAPQGAKLEDAG